MTRRGMSGEGLESKQPPGPIFHRHMWNTIVVLERGNRTQTHCPMCNMFVTWRYLKGIQTATEIRTRGEESKIRFLVEEEACVGSSMAF